MKRVVLISLISHYIALCQTKQPKNQNNGPNYGKMHIGDVYYKYKDYTVNNYYKDTTANLPDSENVAFEFTKITDSEYTMAVFPIQGSWDDPFLIMPKEYYNSTNILNLANKFGQRNLTGTCAFNTQDNIKIDTFTNLLFEEIIYSEPECTIKKPYTIKLSRYLPRLMIFGDYASETKRYIYIDRKLYIIPTH